MRSSALRKLFVSYSGVVFLVALICSVIVWNTARNNAAAQTAEANQRTAAALASEQDRFFYNIIVNAQVMNQIPWVNKLYVSTESFDSEYTLSRKRDIASNFQMQMNSIPSYVKQIALLFPYRDICILPKCWVDVATGLSMLGVSGPAHADMLASIRGTKEIAQLVPAEGLGDDVIVVCMPLEKMARSRAYICYFISKEKYQAYLKKNMPADVSSIVIENSENGFSLAVSGSADRAESVYTHESLYLPWKYIISFGNSLFIENFISEMMHLYRNYVWILPLGVLLSYALALVTNRPLAALTRKIRAMEGGLPLAGCDNDYQMIEKCIDTYRAENEKMRVYAGEYKGMLCSQLIHSLLQGSYDKSKIAGQLEAQGLAFSENGVYQVFLIAGESAVLEKIDNTAYVENEIMGAREHRITICDRTHNEMVMIVALYDGKAVPDNGGLLPGKLILSALSQSDITLISGSVENGLEGIHRSYQYALEKYTHLFAGDFPGSEYPIELQNQLLNALRAGNPESALCVLKQIYDKNERFFRRESSPHSAIRLISRVLDTAVCVREEFGIVDSFIDDELTALLVNGMIGESWGSIEQVCLKICGRTALSSVDRDGQQVERLLEYVGANLSNEILSLSHLEDVFHLSQQTINRLFKQYTGKTCHVYITCRRMEMAQDLLRNQGIPITDVASRTGYSNTISFRRAFIRHTGVCPSEYRPGAHI